jgi:MYXO-CTERM domain-containing protein
VLVARIGVDGTVIELHSTEGGVSWVLHASCAGTCLLVDFGLGGRVAVRVTQVSAAVPIDLDAGSSPGCGWLGVVLLAILVRVSRRRSETHAVACGGDPRADR